jgi:HlyD family secretion protein
MKLAMSGGAVLGRIIPKKVAVPIGPLPGASRAAQKGALPKGALVPKPFRGPIMAGCAIILFFFVGLGGWAAYAPLSSASAASGTVIVDSKRKIIQHLEGGIVREILVHDNDTVKAGQVLLRMDDTQAKARLQLITGRYFSDLALIARLQAEQVGKADIDFPAELLAKKDDPEIAKRIEEQRTLFRARADEMTSQTKLLAQRDAELNEEVKGHEGQIAAAAKQSTLIATEIKVVNDLLASGLALKPRLLALERQSAEIEGQTSANQAMIARARQTMGDTKLRIAELHTERSNEVVKQLADVQKDLFDLSEQRRAAQDTLDREEVRSPDDGIVVNLTVNTPGGVIGAGQPLLEIVPSLDRLVIDAHLEVNDIEKVKPGAKAEVRLLAYSIRTTPTLDARVVWISADRIETDKLRPPYYDARVEIDEAQLAALPDVKLYPGMPVQIMMVSGSQTMLDYLMAPITQAFSQAFREK